MTETTALKNIPVGKNFKVWNREFTVLKQEEDKTFVLATELATIMPFRKDDKDYKVAPNDYRDSSIKEYLNNEYIDELINAGAIDDDILPLTIDLKCTLGQHEYGTDTVQAGLLTLEQYGEFYDIIPLIEDDWWCLATPWKTSSYSPNINNTNYICGIYTNGDWLDNSYRNLYGVRPALNLNPELMVTYESDEENEEISSESADNWNNYIKYLHKWAVEHDDKAFTGNSPACYDEWLDNESEEE